jgi:hypothetical protein
MAPSSQEGDGGMSMNLFFDQDGISRRWCVRVSTVVMILTAVLAIVGMMSLLEVLVHA